MRSSTAELLDALVNEQTFVDRITPWGVMRCVGTNDRNLTVKFITVDYGARTSLQYHERKDELIVIIADYGVGFIQLGDDPSTATLHGSDDGRFVRIRPGVHHRVTGPMEYFEISTYDDDADTVRIADDYGRA